MHRQHEQDRIDEEDVLVHPGHVVVGEDHHEKKQRAQQTEYDLHHPAVDSERLFPAQKNQGRPDSAEHKAHDDRESDVGAGFLRHRHEGAGGAVHRCPLKTEIPDHGVLEDFRKEHLVPERGVPVYVAALKEVKGPQYKMIARERARSLGPEAASRLSLSPCLELPACGTVYDVAQPGGAVVSVMVVEIDAVLFAHVAVQKSDYRLLLRRRKRQDHLTHSPAVGVDCPQLVFCIGRAADKPQPPEGEVDEEILVVEGKRTVVESDVAPLGRGDQEGRMPEPRVDGIARAYGQKRDRAGIPVGHAAVVGLVIKRIEHGDRIECVLRMCA